MNITIDALTSNIQLALAPVFLLTAVATLVGAISTRLARTVDRMRFIQNALYGDQIVSEKLRSHYEIELREFKMRGRLCTVAIFFNVLSGVLISLTVLELFFFQTGSVQLLQTGYVVATFVLGLISFMTSLLIVLAEVMHAYRSASWNMPPSWDHWFCLNTLSLFTLITSANNLSPLFSWKTHDKKPCLNPYD